MSEGTRADRARLVTIFEEPSSFRSNVAETVVSLGHPVELVGSWEDACAFMKARGSQVAIGLFAPQLPGAPHDLLPVVFHERFEQRFPFFCSVNERPPVVDCQRIRDEGGCGFLERTSSIREIAFRIDACIRRLTPSTFVAAPRVQLNAPVLFSLAKRPNQSWQSGILRNFSRCGVYMSTPFSPPLGEQLELSFSLSAENAEHVRCHGRVIRQADKAHENEPQNGMGIAFEGLSYEVEHRFSEFVMQELGAPLSF